MVLFSSLLALILFAWIGLRQIRGFRYGQIAREYFARWSMLDAIEKQRLLRHCYPERKVPTDEGLMDSLFTDFVQKKWVEMRGKGFYDFDALRVYLSKLISFACRASETPMTSDAQRFS